MAQDLNAMMNNLKAGDAIIVRGVIPNSGMAAAFNQRGDFTVIGGKGSAYGGLETRTGRKPRTETGGYFGQSFSSGYQAIKDYISDPTAYRKAKADEKKKNDEAKKFGLQRSEITLLTQSPGAMYASSLDYSAAVASGSMQLLQIIARNIIGIARSIGVSGQNIISLPNPERSWFGGMLTSMSKDLKKIPGVGAATTTAKHLQTILSFLNPFSMGTRVMRGTVGMGRLIQQLMMGKGWRELSKNPNLAFEKAGLKQDINTQMLNTARAQTNYLRELVNLNQNSLRALITLIRTFGGKFTVQRADITHDDYSGELKTYRQFYADEAKRNEKLLSVQNQAARGGLFGMVGGAFSDWRTRAEQKRSSRSDVANEFDRQMIIEMFANGFFEKYGIRVAPPRKGWYGTDQSTMAELSEIKRLVVNYPQTHNLSETQAKEFFATMNLYREMAFMTRSRSHVRNARTSMVNAFSRVSGGRRVLTAAESIGQHQLYHNVGYDVTQAQILNAADRINTARTDYANHPVRRFLRMIPGYGVYAGVRDALNQANFEQVQDTSLAARSRARLNSPASLQNLFSDDVNEFKLNPIVQGFQDALVEVFFKMETSSYGQKDWKSRSIAGNISSLDAKRNGRGNSSKNQIINFESEDIKSIIIDLFYNHETGTFTNKPIEKRSIAQHLANIDMDLGELGNRKKQPVGRTLVEIRDILQSWNKSKIAENDLSFNARENADRLRQQHDKATKRKPIFDLTRFTDLSWNNKRTNDIYQQKDSDSSKKSGFLWKGLAAAGLFSMIPEEAKAEIIKPILKTAGSFVLDVLNFSKDQFFNFASKAIDFAGENPLTMASVGSAVALKMFPGVVGNTIAGLGKIAFAHPIAAMITLGVGGLVYNVYSAYQRNKEKGGSFGDLVYEILLGGEGGITNAMGKAGTYGIIGAGIGTMAAPVIGTVIGFLAGAAVGGIIGAIGEDGVDKYIINSHNVVAEWMKWKPGSLAYKLAESGKFIPYVGPLLFGLVGSMIPDNTLTRGVLETTGIIEEGSITEYSSDQDKHKDEKHVNNLQKTSWWKNLPAKKREEYESEPSEYKRNKKIQADFENHTRQRVYSRAQELQDEFGGPNENIPITSQNAQLPKPSNFSNVSYNDLNFGEKLIADSVKSIFSIGSAASAALGLGGSGLMTSSGWSNSSNSSLGGYTPIDISTLSDELGSLSASQESNNDPRTIGYDSKGGTSYGTYQLASAQGTPKTFLEYVRKNGGDYGKEIYDTMYRACGGNWSRLNTGSKSGTPVDAWRAIASKDPIAFHKLEHDFFVQEYYGKAFKQLNPEVQEIVKKNRALQEALFSTSVQHGQSKGAKIVLPR